VHRVAIHRAEQVDGEGADPLAPTSLTDEIVLRLENAILEGVYPPGTRLRQDELCVRFGVSRTPVREALRTLQARNLVEVMANRGATVRIPSRKDAAELYAVRAELEGYACELAARSPTAQLLGALSAAQGRLDRLVARVQRSGSASPSVQVQMHRANEEFHRTIHRAVGNDRLVAMIEQLEHSFPTEYIGPAMTGADEVWALNAGEHAEVRDAIARSDGASARDRMRSHVLHLSAVVLRYLDARGFWR
jgi:DNA-binding GntR family transcriptional regulator